MAIIDVSLYESIHPGWTADSTAVTADSIVYTADGGPLVGAVEAIDAVVNANFISVDIVEPVASVWTADSTAVTADSTYWTADGGPLEGARDAADASVIPAIIEVPIGGGVYPPRRRPRAVVGYGYGILPELEGEAHGVVVLAGRGLVPFPGLSGAVAGAAGVAGRSAGQLIVGAAAIGQLGTRGTGSGAIMKLGATAIGRYDDDEAAMITFLLAA